MLHGDTAVSPLGLDTYGSRSLPVGGVALWHASQKVIEKARQIVAHQLEVSGDDLEYEAGAFTVKGSPDKTMTIKEARVGGVRGAQPARTAWSRASRRWRVYDPPNFSWPGGAHAAVVEVDTETGDARLVRYVAVDDVGTMVNPLIVEGQIHGGIAQGVAAALYEEGRLRRGRQSADAEPRHVPRARRPSSCRRSSSTRRRRRAPTNPLGVKGVGETGTIASRRRGHERRGRRALPPRCHRYPDAGHARACLARDPGGEAVIPAAFDYDVAESVDHAIELLGADEDAKLLAGGHSLIPALKLRIARPSKLVDIGRLAELSYVRDAGDAARDRRADAAQGRPRRPAPAGALPDRARRRRG